MTLIDSIMPLVPALLLGQLTNNSALTVAAGAVILAAGLNQVLTLMDRFREPRTPRMRIETSGDQEPRRRGDCIAIHSKDREWIRTVEAEARQSVKESSDKLNSRIDTLHVSMNAQFNSVAGKLGRICGRLGIEGSADE